MHSSSTWAAATNGLLPDPFLCCEPVFATVRYMCQLLDGALSGQVASLMTDRHLWCLLCVPGNLSRWDIHSRCDRKKLVRHKPLVEASSSSSSQCASCVSVAVVVVAVVVAVGRSSSSNSSGGGSVVVAGRAVEQ